MSTFYTEFLKNILAFVLLYTFFSPSPSSNVTFFIEHKILVKQTYPSDDKLLRMKRASKSEVGDSSYKER